MKDVLVADPASRAIRLLSPKKAEIIILDQGSGAELTIPFSDLDLVVCEPEVSYLDVPTVPGDLRGFMYFDEPPAPVPVEPPPNPLIELSKKLMAALRRRAELELEGRLRARAFRDPCIPLEPPRHRSQRQFRLQARRRGGR